ncbi:hypothetical protein ACJIZ3_019380 [Penstemon smallii]|uniref:Uncharacterized protein n=1 Tax=Penstemon smallii TaxID=265156 RepID=A0ABD3T294_9LAMI
MIANYWWNKKDTYKIHWVKWDTLCDSKRDGGLGFRDLDSFNTALLAKQAWRILSRPDSLISRVLRAKYFPNHDLLEAPLGPKPSLTWRSIWGSIHTLQSGLRWRVGDGNTIHIWGDKWLPRSHNFLVSTPPSLLPANATVSALIDDDLGIWNRDLIFSCFSEEEAAAILSIPLGNRVFTDSLIWHFDRSGSFTVRSAYRLIRELKAAAREALTGGPSVRQIRNWDWIWKLHVPPKVKHFVWSCCSGSIPVRSQLRHRNVTEEASCLRCGCEEETTIHCLYSCTYARQIWALSELPYSSYSSDSSDIESWFNQVRKNLDSKDFGFFSSLCWWIWFSRNKLMWEDRDTQPQILVNSVRGFHRRFVASRSITPSTASNRSNLHWIPPSSNYIKINFDAAVGNSGDGVAETTAALRAVQFAIESGWQRIILEGDCLNVIKGIVIREASLSSVGCILEEIKVLCRSFSSFSACHTIRENNRAAHELARLAYLDSCFYPVLPSAVLEIVLSELSLI